MAAPSRTAQFSRLHKILKKHYSPVAPASNRSLLEHLLFASCLENAHYRAAEEAFVALVHTFYDWNEIRVSSVRELSEVAAGLPDPSAAAHRVKRILQSVFEATYSFDLEELRKQNLGPAVERIEKIEGVTKFSAAYVVQSALGGHSIPIDSATLGALHQVDLATDEDVAAGTVPGLERAIAKNVGIEFGSLLHQLGADFAASPYSPSLHAILLEIDPKAKDRLPSRRAGKRAGSTPVQPSGSSAEAKGKKADLGAPKAAADAESPGEAAVPAEAKGQAKVPSLEPKRKPTTSKRKMGAETTVPEPPASAEAPHKKESEPAEAHAPQAGRKKPVPPSKKPASKRKPEEAKARRPQDQDDGVPDPNVIAKRKPR